MTITAYKGFRRDMTCRGMQYTVGETHTHDGNVNPCQSGLHACLYPLDVLLHYSPHTSRFAVVQTGDYVLSDDGDTKIAARTLRVMEELTPCQLVDAAASQVESSVNLQSSFSSRHGYAVSRTSGEKSQTAGGSSVALSTHHNSMALAIGGRSVAAATGECSLSRVINPHSVAAVAAPLSVAHSYAPDAIAAAANIYSAAKAEGVGSIAACAGGHSISASVLRGSIAVSSGVASLSVCEGDSSIAAASGGFASSRCKRPHSVALSTGRDGSAAVEDVDSVAIALGRGSRAQAEEDGFIVCGYRNSAGHLLHLRAAKVGENGIKPGVWYTLDEHGEFVEVEL